MSNKQLRPRLTKEEFKVVENYRKQNNIKKGSAEQRILVIGDLHEPFTLDGYLAFCKDQYQKHGCNRVIFIGDIIDNHYSSYHEQDPDGMSAGEELEYSIKKIKKWYKAFPNADVIIGNHDRMAYRKAQSSGLSKKWIRAYDEVLGTPKWNFTERVVYDGVQYVHGEGGTARTKAKNDLMSTVQGHIHTQAYTEWMVGANFKIFGMQVGCGVDSENYAMAYAKAYKKQAIGCGIVIGGHTAINELMDL